MTRQVLELIRDDLESLLSRVESALAALDAPAAPTTTAAIAWGAKVSQAFRDRVRWIGTDLGLDPNHLMACIAWESGRSFRPDVKNMAGSGATGLIQFMPSTAKALGTSVEALAAMTAEDQLNEVWKYFKPYKGKLKTLSDVYMAILWPKGVGQPEDYPLFTGGITYRQNAGLDVDKDGVVTKREAASKVAKLLSEGLQPNNLA